MIITIFILLLLAATISIFEEYLKDYRKYILIGFGVVLIIIAAVRPIGIDRDSENYEVVYNHYDDTVQEKLVEYSFLWLSMMLNKVSDDVHIIFFLFALLSIPLKLYGITKLSPIWFSSLLIYLSNYYLLHELTQIRAGVAAGFFLIAIYYQSEGQKWKSLPLVILSIVFHYSSIVLLPLLFLSNEKMTGIWKYVWASIIPIAYLLHFMHVGLTTLPIPYISDKMDIYVEMRDRGIMGDETINVFNVVFTFKVLIYYYLMFFEETISSYNKAFPYMLRLYCISLFSFIFLADMPVFAFRISEIFGIVEIILFSNIYFTIKPAYISKIIISFIGIFFFLFNIFQNELLTE